MFKTVYRGEAPYLDPLMDWAKEVLFDIWELDRTNQPNCWIAGGAPLDILRGEDPRDIDVWFNSEDDLTNVVAAFLRLYSGHLESNTENTAEYTFANRGRFELVKRFFDTAEETLETFDITVASIAVGFDYVVFNESLFEHLATSSMVFQNIDRPVHTLRRIPKYVAKGFFPSDEELKRLAMRIADLDSGDEVEKVFTSAMAQGSYNNLPRDIKSVNVPTTVVNKMQQTKTPIPARKGFSGFRKRARTKPPKDPSNKPVLSDY